MPKKDIPASDTTAGSNLYEIGKEYEPGEGPNALKRKMISDDLRRELSSKGLKGFKKGGKVKKTAVYKLHKGEKVIPAKKVTQDRRNRMRRAMIGDK